MYLVYIFNGVRTTAVEYSYVLRHSNRGTPYNQRSPTALAQMIILILRRAHSTNSY